MTPQDLGARAGTVASAFSEAARAWPDRLAIGFEEHRLTYAELDDVARRLAGGLRAAGVGHGDRVLLLARNRWEHAQWLLAVARLGAVYVSVHPDWTAVELSRVVAEAEPSAVAHEAPLAGVVAEALGGAPVPTFDLDAPVAAGLASHPPAEGDHARAGDLAALWYTSGSSGRPKGVVWTHDAFLFNALVINHAFGIGPDDVGMRISPMSHNGISSAVIGTMLRGAPVHVVRKFDAERILDLVRREGVTWTNLVPAAAQLLLNAADEHGVESLPSLRRLLVGAAPTPRAVLERLERFLPHCAVLHGYGATEGYIAACRPEDDRRVDGTVGPPLPGVEVRVVDEVGQPSAPGTLGRVLFRSPGVMHSYWHNPEATAAALSPDGWMDVGDLGSMDERGRLTVKGRSTDVVNTGGYNVHASEVEAALHTIEGVAAAAVLGAPDDLLGERVVAFVEPRPGVQLDVDGVRAECVRLLARYKRPVDITIVEALPRNTYGKLDKRALRQEWVDATG